MLEVSEASAEELAALLGGDPIANAGFVEHMRIYSMERAARCGSSCAAVFRFKEERWGALSSKDEAEAKLLASIFEGIGCVNICPASDWSIKAAFGGSKPTGSRRYKVLYLPDGAEVPEPSGEAVAIGVAHAGTICDAYRDESLFGIDYVTERILGGPSFGVFRDGRLVGWAMTHDDFAMGFMMVLPEYRRQGIAMEITLSLIKALRSMGRVPMVHVSKDNHKSLSLVRSLGFIEACDIIFTD